MLDKADLRLAIQVLTNKRDEYNGIAINGRYRYHDPEDEIRVWESMRDRLTRVIAHLNEERDAT
jgi:hypothetical protein